MSGHVLYSQQAAEKALKALGMKLGFQLWGHSLTEMLKILNGSGKIGIPEDIKRKGRLLDRYYVPTRYPNGFTAGKPADYYGRSEAEEAIDAADSIIGFCEGHLH